MLNPKSILSFLATAAAMAGLCVPVVAQSYKVTNMVSDGSVPAITTDPNFINPWGVSASGTWWISAASTGYNYVVPAATSAISFKVIVPTAASGSVLPGFPAGSVTTGGATGMILPNGTKASFIFSTLDGTLAGWNSKLGTANAVSQVVVNNSATSASYTGLALLNTPATGTVTNSYLLAPNFNTAAIEVYDNTFKPVTLSGGTFTDPALPTGYAPFSVHVLGSQVIVAYALRTAKAPFISSDGPGNGVVSIFDNTGKFVARAVTGGNLNSPWGVAYAPANFGVFSNDLLIGNFGDGKINAYDPKTFVYQGQLMDSTGKSLVYASLWDLLTGGTSVTGTTAVSGGDTSTVYFAAGLAKEQHGLFAGISNGVTAGSTPTFGMSTETSALTAKIGGSAQAAISVASTNGFTGTVSFTCSGLPVGASCFFSPTTLNVSPNAPALGSIIIETQKAIGANRSQHPTGVYAAGFSLAALVSFGMMFGRRRRRFSSSLVRLAAVALFAIAASGFLAGCGDALVSAPATPAGQSSVVVTATAGAVSQTTTIALTVQ